MMVFFYVLALSLLLVCYMFYNAVAAFRSGESERRRLEQVELRLAHILRLVEAPDVRLLMQNEESRQALLLEFSESLRKDVLELLRARELRIASLFWAAVFFSSYYLIRLKSKLVCGRADLRFLSGLELALFRTLD